MNLFFVLCFLFFAVQVRENSQRVGAKLKLIRHLVLMSIKSKLMDTALRATSSRGHHRQPQVVINRYQAQQSKEQGHITPDTSKSSFVQTFSQMYGKITWASLRGTEKVFRVSYAGGLGEQGVDAGGPYRETLTEVCKFLFCVNSVNLVVLLLVFSWFSDIDKLTFCNSSLLRSFFSSFLLLQVLIYSTVKY